MRFKTWLVLAVGMLGALAATGVRSAEFPAEATPLDATQLRERLADKVFDVQLANGTSWRLQHNAGGAVFVNTSNGYNNSGDWRTEDGRLCTSLKGRDPGCSAVRLHEGVVLVKRDDGEILRLIPR